MSRFMEASQPRDIETQTESETQLAELEKRLKWFFERGIHINVKPCKEGYKLVLLQPRTVFVEPK